MQNRFYLFWGFFSIYANAKDVIILKINKEAVMTWRKSY